LSKFQRHFFVCVNRRPDGGKGSCAGRGSEAIVARLRNELAGHPELWSSVTVTETGCLGPCTEGPTVVVYPEGIWYSGVDAAGADEIAREHLAQGRSVERLVYRWPED
jgi:(2Fe-2S) ferredoxin